MTHSARPLNRRPRVERQILAILRGEKGAMPQPPGTTCFLRLRILARRQGIALLPPGTPYLGEGELTLLSWIAAAQRTVPAGFRPANACLAAVAARCAGRLGDLGLRLYPFTLYSHHLRELAALDTD